MNLKIPNLGLNTSFAALLVASASAVVIEGGCRPADDAERTSAVRSRIDASDCGEYGGNWSNGKCTLPGGTTIVDVPIPHDDAPIEPWTGPPPDDDPCSNAPCAPPPPGPGTDPPPPPPLLPPSPPEVPDDVKQRVSACVDAVDYNALPVQYAPAGEMYTNHSGSTAWSVASYLGGAAGWLVNTSDQTRSWVEYLTFGGTAANNYLDSVMTQINAKFASAAASGHPFQNYQKVCLAQCIASQIIEYGENNFSKFGGVSMAVAQGVGVCTEFSGIAQRIIASTAGSSVDSWVGVSPGHAFVQVSFDNNTYSIEPQKDPRLQGACEFRH